MSKFLHKLTAAPHQTKPDKSGADDGERCRLRYGRCGCREIEVNILFQREIRCRAVSQPAYDINGTTVVVQRNVREKYERTTVTCVVVGIIGDGAATSTLVEVDPITIKSKAAIGTRQVKRGERTTAMVRDSNKGVIDAVVVGLRPKRRRYPTICPKGDQPVAVCRTANSAASFRSMAVDMVTMANAAPAVIMSPVSNVFTTLILTSYI